MRLAYFLIVPLTACATSDDGDYRVEPQGSPAPPAGTTSGEFVGRVCITEDLRSPSGCGTRDRGGITVTSGEAATVTADDGSFSLPVDAMNPSVTVTGNGVIPTTVPVRDSNALQVIPAIDATIYNNMLAETGIALEAGTGSILASVSANGAPSIGATATSTPESPFGPFFDGDTPTNWGIDGTGQRGVVWIPGLSAGPVDVSFANALGGQESLVAGVSVRNGGVTILDTSFTTQF